MIKKDNFFKNFFISSKIYNQNIKKTKNIFFSFKEDFKNGEIPFLESYTKDYKFEFSNKILQKYSKYKNIVVFGMGGSILGTKSIYSFLKKKIKKQVFFFDNLDISLNSKYKSIKNLKNSCFIVVSKSGNTLETISNANIIIKKSDKNTFVLTRGIDLCIWVYPLSEWKKIEIELTQLSSLSTTNRIFLRNHLRHARMASCDAQGRVILSKQLIKYAKIVKDLTIIGVLNKVEIWDKRTLIFSDKKTVVDDDSYEELSKKVTV